MKWNVEKASRVIDAIIGMAVAYFLVDTLWIDGSIDSDMIMPLYVGLVSMLAYRIGIWSGRKLERMDIEPVQSVRRLENQGQQPKPPTTPMPPLKKPKK